MWEVLTGVATWLLMTLGGLVVVTTLLPLVRKGYWWIRVFDFPRTQIAVLGLLVLAASPLLVPWDAFQGGLLLAVFSCVLGQGRRIFPYTAIAPRQVRQSGLPPAAGRIRIVVANILMYNREYERFLSVIREADPDILAVIEADLPWMKAIGDYVSHFSHRLEQPQDNTYGLLLYSRLKLRDTRCRFLVEPGVPSMSTIVSLPGGGEADLYVLHPRPPQPFQDSFERDAELLIVGRKVRERKRPAIVVGDLNDVAWSITTRLFQRTSGLLDPRLGRGLFSSFHAKIPFLRWPLDHVFHSSEFQLVEMRRLSGVGSDHFPICVDLAYVPQASDRHKPPTARDEDDVEALRRIGDGLSDDR